MNFGVLLRFSEIFFCQSCQKATKGFITPLHHNSVIKGLVDK